MTRIAIALLLILQSAQAAAHSGPHPDLAGTFVHVLTHGDHLLEIAAGSVTVLSVIGLARSLWSLLRRRKEVS